MFIPNLMRMTCTQTDVENSQKDVGLKICLHWIWCFMILEIVNGLNLFLH